MTNKSSTINKDTLPPLTRIEPTANCRYELSDDENFLPLASNRLEPATPATNTSKVQKRKLNTSVPNTTRKIPKSSEKTRRFVNLTRMHEDNAKYTEKYR